MSKRISVPFKHLVAALGAASALTVGAGPARAANTAPVVLVHGFAGFGRDEALGYKYWGGLVDLEKQLTAEGRTTYTAVVGPFSSNWDRAVELYYQIKGGCVDYGEAHADTFGHERDVAEKCFPGLYPQWDAAHPIHLVGHSMGGQTTRMLVHLLEADGEPHEPGLFNGTKSGWVTSVTTLAAPNNGTSLTAVVTDHVPFVVDLVGNISALAGIVAQDSFLYNFKLEQWGLRRSPGEGFCSYRDRVKSSSIWTSPVARTDLSLYSLSPDGAAEENEWVDTWPDVYYFSYATKTTYKGLFTGWHYPLASTNAIIVPFAHPAAWPLPAGIGNFTTNQPGQVVVDSTWWANDAVVNTKSMAGPWDPTSTIVAWNGTPQQGKWNYMGLLDGFDHFDVVGWTLFWDAKSFYSSHVNRLRAL